MIDLAVTRYAWSFFISLLPSLNLLFVLNSVARVTVEQRNLPFPFLNRMSAMVVKHQNGWKLIALRIIGSWIAAAWLLIMGGSCDLGLNSANE